MFGCRSIGFRLEVRRRAASARPYGWEIYRDAGPAPVEVSTETYAAADEARRAGASALQKQIARGKKPSPQSWT
jgi:hypothetical protein